MTEEEYRQAKERNQKRREERERKRRQSRRLLAGFLVLVLLVAIGAVAVPKILNRNKKSEEASSETSSDISGNQEASKEEASGSAGEAEPESTEPESTEPESTEPESSSEPVEEESSQEESSEEESVPEEPVTKTVNLAAIGDIMVHLEQLQFAYDPNTDSFDFAPSFEMIKDDLSAHDYTVANLETTFGIEDTWTADRFHGYTGFPCFSSPEILATNIKDAGIDFVGTANNHALDAHADGIQLTLERVHAAGLESTGTFSELDAPRYQIEEVNGMRIAFMAYTYGSNGFQMPKGEEGYFNSFVDYHQDLIDQMYVDVQEVNELPDVDLIVMLLHMGEEYWYTPTLKTQEVVDELFKSGCDIILTSHPHVLEPFEFRNVDNGDGTTRQGFVIYSLGNFISAQHYVGGGYYTDVGVILDLDLEQVGEEQPTITGLRLTPTYCQWTGDNIRVIPLEKALDSYVNGNNAYNCTDTHYQRLLDSQRFFQNTIWPSQYAYTIENGGYVVDMTTAWPAETEEEAASE